MSEKPLEQKQSLYYSCRLSPVFATCWFNVLSHFSHSALQQAGRNPSHATLNKYWTPRTSKLNFDDFCEILKGEKKTEETELMRAFKKMDVNGDGYISHSELEKALITVSLLKHFILDRSAYCFRFISDSNHWSTHARTKTKYFISSGVFTTNETMLNLPERRQNDHWRGECYFLIGWHQQRRQTGLCRSKFRQVRSDFYSYWYCNHSAVYTTLVRLSYVSKPVEKCILNTLVTSLCISYLNI